MIKLRIIIFILLSFCIYVSISAKEHKYSYKIDVSNSELSRTIKQVINSEIDERALNDSLKTIISNFGYLDAAIHQSENEFSINSGALYLIKKISVDAHDSLSIITEVPFVETESDKLIKQIKEQFESNGHYYVQLNVKDIIIEQKEVELILTVNKGPILKLNSVKYKGLNKVKPNRLDRYLPDNRDNLITPDYIEKVEEALENLDYVRFVPPVQLMPLAGFADADLYLDFIEKRQFKFEGGVGYISTNQDELVWNINTEILNLFGEGRELTFRSEKREKGNNILDILYSQPSFWPVIGRQSIRLNTRDYRNDFSEFGVRLSQTFLLKRKLTGGLTLGLKRIEPATLLSGYKRYAIQFSIINNSQTPTINPESGFNLEWDVEFAHRRYDLDSLSIDPEKRILNETKTDFSLSHVRNIFSSFYGYTKIRYIGFETSESLPPLSEMILIGGPGTIRGFRNDQFAVQRCAILSLEPRVRFNSGFVFGFYDGAYLNRPLIDINSNLIRDEFYEHSYGLGLKVFSNDKHLAISFGWNKRLSFDQPRLSISFGSEL